MSAATVTIRRTLDARQMDVRARILHAARQLINEQGHETVGMEAIAATAGVSRATMYRYFASKEHVVCDAALAGATNSRRASPGDRRGVRFALRHRRRHRTGGPRSRIGLPMVRATMTSVLALGLVADEFRLGVRQMFDALTAGTDPPRAMDAAMTLLGRVFFADLALLSVGDITVEQCIDELRTAAQRIYSAPAHRRPR